MTFDEVQRVRRSILIGAVAVMVLTDIGGCTAFMTPPALPSEKAALESAAAAFQSSAPRGDKSADPGRPSPVATDSPPETGLFRDANAPASGSIFNPSGEWAGWIDADTFAQVWAGADPGHGNRGVVLMMRRPGIGDRAHLDPDGSPTQSFVEPPVTTGPLTMTAVRNGLLLMRDAKGVKLTFSPVTGAFVTP